LDIIKVFVTPRVAVCLVLKKYARRTSSVIDYTNICRLTPEVDFGGRN